ncbi:glycosyltransferase family 2 protein [Paracoccus aestuariivivens]|uniref:Glycosyltransferase n=1 Tax=Paracoccus aestuariivivens TaxID=1820333 RepID=A0A6L6J7B7_9RHOB|nr:glycosyltransferase family A protein [Paracoccus aestuariivivens]MTH76629.1 glycosyltransferase [Paracoccus aestuariivivens]
MAQRRENIRASVIVVSRNRPRELAQCLQALTQQSYPAFELVLVADPDSIQVRPDLPIKRVTVDEPNISTARNLGIAAASGDVVLFIDDDALAVSRWVEFLVDPFRDPRVIAATGFTRGPDGLHWQVRAERMTASGRSEPIEVGSPILLGPENGAPVSTIGTNCAFRRSALVEIGGFDPVFAYYLDESDVNFRMAKRFGDGLTAVIPKAEVIHGLAPGVSRDEAGIPEDLRAIGRSSAIFAARYGGAVDGLRQSQRARLLRHMIAGRIDPLSVGPILRTLDEGIAEGATINAPLPKFQDIEMGDFLPMPVGAGERVYLSGWYWQRHKLQKKALAQTKNGRLVTIIILTPTFLPHRKHLHPDGWWEQHGGVWGASQPGDSALMLMGARTRFLRERAFFAATQQ